MGITRALVLVSLAAAAVLAHARPVFACDCHGGGPVCQDFWKTPVVFVGRVEAVTPTPSRSDHRDGAKVRFRVIEALRGTTAREIEIHTTFTSCDLGFGPGEEWVIYASPGGRGEGLRTSTCSRSAPLREAAEDVAYGRSVLWRRADKGRVFGQLTYSRKNGWTGVPGIRINVDGLHAEPISAVTDEEGRYEFLAPAGTYRLTAALPPGMTFPSQDHSVELQDNRGCAEANLSADYPGQVAGRVLDASGNPVANVTVELMNIDGFDYASYRLRGVTDEAGGYAIPGVEPGNYAPAVAIGRTITSVGAEPLYVFAGLARTTKEARPVDIAGGSRRVAGDLVLPEATRTAQISGFVVQADGRPAAGVKVRTKAAFDSGNFPWTTIRTDSHGAFTFALVLGMQYRLVAENDAGKEVRLTVDPSQSTSTLRLVLP